MKKHLNTILLFTLLFLTCTILSCADKYSKTDLYGTWKVADWKIESTGKSVSNKMDMDFKSDGMYGIDYGSKKESGKYWISGEYLHTVAEGKTEMSVKIINLTADTLELQMNRGGSLEHVTLLHQ